MGTILFPTFEEASKFTLDPHWKELFLGCARNKFPKGLTYDPDDNLLHVVGKDEPIELEDDPLSVHQIMMQVFREDLSLFASKIDRKREQEFERVQKERLAEREETEWKKIRSKEIKDRLIGEYIARLRNELELNARQARQLRALISIGFQYRQLLPSDVILEEGEITDILNLEFEDGAFDLVRDPIYTRTAKTSSRNDLEQNGGKAPRDRWGVGIESYLKALLKKKVFE